METVNYLSLIEQKTVIIKKLRNLDAKQFAAESNGEIDEIARQRKDLKVALSSINKILNPTSQ